FAETVYPKTLVTFSYSPFFLRKKIKPRKSHVASVLTVRPPFLSDEFTVLPPFFLMREQMVLLFREPLSVVVLSVGNNKCVLKEWEPCQSLLAVD
ncbi:hypothetical protein C5167_014557, partial [Papaver somniferum]